MKRFVSAVFILMLLTAMVNVGAVEGETGVIRGTDIFSIWSNSTISYMNYNATERIFTAIVTGENGTIGVFKIIFNASTPPRLICFDNTTFDMRNGSQTVNNVTLIMANITWYFNKTYSYPAINVTLIYKHSKHLIRIDLIKLMREQEKIISILVVIAVYAFVFVVAPIVMIIMLFREDRYEKIKEEVRKEIENRL